MNEISPRGCGIRRGSLCEAGPKPEVARTSVDEICKADSPPFLSGYKLFYEKGCYADFNPELGSSFYTSGCKICGWNPTN